MQYSIMILGSISMTVIVNKWVLIPIVPLLFLFIHIRKYYLATSTELKRIEGKSRSPIFVHINNTLTGLSPIRAANMQNTVNDEFYIHNDYHTRACQCINYTACWLGSRLGK